MGLMSREISSLVLASDVENEIESGVTLIVSSAKAKICLSMDQFMDFTTNLDILKRGDMVTASGPPFEIRKKLMVPILPQGMVLLDELSVTQANSVWEVVGSSGKGG